MLVSSPSEHDWQIRHFVYTYFVKHAQPPTSGQAAAEFGLTPEAGRLAYQRLHQHHAFYLEPGTDRIRIANPLSAVPTPFRVSALGQRYWANCAWDSLGIPAMLNEDAEIEADSPLTGETVTYAIEAMALRAGEFVVHFPLPFRRWYDDLIHT